MDGATHQQVWRHTYGQPRGFDARFSFAKKSCWDQISFSCSLLKPNVKVHPWRVLWSCLGCWGQLSHHRRVKHGLLLSQLRNLPLFRLSMWLPVLSHDTITIINRSSIKNMIKYNIYSLSNYATCPSLGLGMSTIMRKPMLMGGAAIPGWGFFRRSSLICLLSCVLCLFFVVRNVCILVFLLGVIPCGHLTKWRNCFQWGLWWQGGEQCR